MAITIPTFRQQFPEFSDPVTYSDVVIQVWDTVALSLLDPTRWGTLLVYGESLFVAHHLVIGARAIGGVLLGLAVIGLEAWLRVPVRPLFDGYVQEAQARVSAFFRNLSF